MKTQIDLKSVLVGLVVGVLAVFAIGASSFSAQSPGRYQIVAFNAGPNMTPNGIIIDTSTGKVWGANLAALSWKDDAGREFIDSKEGK